MIHKINHTITTDCATMTGVRVVHHPTLTPEHLYNHVHLDHSSVWMFAENLRGAAPSPHPIRGAPRHHQDKGHTAHPSQRPSHSPSSRAQPSTARPLKRRPPPNTAHPSPSTAQMRSQPSTPRPGDLQRSRAQHSAGHITP